MSNFPKSNFEQNLLNMFKETQYDYAYASGKADPGYIKLQNDRNSLFRDIQNKLHKDRKLMLKFEDVQSDIEKIDSSLTYIQGFRDCVTLLRLIGVL